MKIRYKIELLAEWHIGSGLDSGANTDAIVLKDSNKLPYIPGKTIKGLLKDSLMEIVDVDKSDKEIVNKIFGGTNDEGKPFSGKAYFSNAELSEAQKQEIVSNNLEKYLCKNVASTAIGKNGIAKKASLRTMEVTIPLTLEGFIELREEIESAKNELKKAFKWTRYIGVNRNRGFGRCKFIIEKN